MDTFTFNTILINNNFSPIPSTKFKDTLISSITLLISTITFDSGIILNNKYPMHFDTEDSRNLTFFRDLRHVFHFKVVLVDVPVEIISNPFSYEL